MTLIEIVLAILILAMSLLPIFGILTSSGAASRSQKAEGVAAGLAKEQMNRYMYVLEKANVVSGAWGLGNPYLVEGNIYEGDVSVVTYGDGVINMDVPEVAPAHNYRSCSTAGEAQGVTFNDVVKTVQVIRNTTIVSLADIKLVVRWRLPSEPTFKATNYIVLVARRAFLK